MFTDSSAEASALGSGPRGRRFKSALSESQKTTTSVGVQLYRGNVQLNAENNVFPLPDSRFREFLLKPTYNSLRKFLHNFIRFLSNVNASLEENPLCSKRRYQRRNTQIIKKKHFLCSRVLNLYLFTEKGRVIDLSSDEIHLYNQCSPDYRL